MGTIYKLTSPSGKVYIGQTINLYKRLNRYKNNLCKNQKKLYNSLVKYGFTNHILEVIKENIPLEELDSIENYYIELYNCVDEGLNCARFAKGPTRGRHCSQETKDLIRSGNLGKKMLVSSRNKMALAKIGKPGNNTGKHMSQESKDKIRTTRLLRGYPCKTNLITNI